MFVYGLRFEFEADVIGSLSSTMPAKHRTAKGVRGFYVSRSIDIALLRSVVDSLKPRLLTPLV